MSNVVLVGFMGSGKTTIAKLLSSKMNLIFIDTDLMISSLFNLSISNIVDKYGIKTMRYFEHHLLIFLCDYCQTSQLNYVISTGGGIVLNPLNKDLLSKIGRIFWLDSSPEMLWQRVSKNLSKRPILSGSASPKSTYFSLYKERYHLYRDFSDIKVNLSRVPFSKIPSYFSI